MTTLLAPDRRTLLDRPNAPARHRRVVAVLALAQFVLAVDATVVNIALPHAQAALGFTDADRQWVVTGYSLGFGSLLLVGGRLADVAGRKRMFLIGLTGFAAASALGGAANSFLMLVAARALQGGFGAMLAPAALALLTVTFTDPKARARAFGLVGGISAAGASLGLMLGGALTEYLDWRWVMYVNVVIAAAGLLGSRILPDDGRDGVPQHGSDLPGAVLAVSGLLAIVFGLSHAAAGERAAPDLLTWSAVIGGVLLLIGFALVERRATHPMLPIRILRDRDRRGALAAMFLSATGVFGILLFLTYYLETALGYSPIRTGLAFLPMALTLMLTGTVGTAVVGTRIGPRVTVPIGLTVAGAGLVLLTRITVHAHYVSAVLPATVVTAVGLGLIFAPSFDLGTAHADATDAGIASATIHVAQQIGGSVGTALLNTVATTSAAAFLAGHAGAGAPVRAAVHSYVTVFWACAAAFGAAALVVTVLLHPRPRGR